MAPASFEEGCPGDSEPLKVTTAPAGGQRRGEAAPYWDSKSLKVTVAAATLGPLTREVEVMLSLGRLPFSGFVRTGVPGLVVVIRKDFGLHDWLAWLTC